MFKILDFTEALHMVSIVNLVTIILAISVALTAVILMIRDIIKSKRGEGKSMSDALTLVLITVVSLMLITVAYAFCTSYLINPKSASTDHYSFEISNNKYISIHPTQSRDIRMEFDTNDLSLTSDDKTRVNMLEIVSETEDRFICEAKSQSKSETIELMKNEHRFVRK